MFKRKPTALLYLRRQSLIFVDKNAQYEKLDIPNNIVANLEVNDVKALSEMTANLLAKHKLHNQNILLILDETTVFKRSIDSKQTDPENVYQDFISKLPFSLEKRTIITVKGKSSQIDYYGTNSDLYNAVVNGIQKSNKARAVVPVNAYVHTRFGKNINRKTIDEFFNQIKLLNTANFITKN